jgi:signal transduction histidine kinase
LPFALLIVVTVLAPFVIEPSVVVAELSWTSVGLISAVAAIAWITYRGSRDPSMLYVSAGASAFAFQALLLIVIDNLPWQAARFQMLAWFSTLGGTLALAACLLFVAPWRDRRGLPPVRPGRVVLLVAAAVATLDMGLIIVGRVTPQIARLLPEVEFVIAVVFLVAGLRTAIVGRTSTRWWLSAAAFAGGIASIALAGGVGIEPVFEPMFEPLSSVQPVASVCIGALLLTGVLTSVRVEASRMRRASDRADEVLGGRAEVAAMLAHEVRGPVATVKSLAATTLQSYDRLSDAERKEFVGLIEQESSRLLDTVTQSSLALKVDARTVDFDRRSVTVGDAVRGAVEATDARGHKVDVDVPVDLRAVGDPKWIAEAFRQGLDNAAKYSPDGAPIGVRARGDGSSLIVEIVDSGPGVPPEQREHVFERFATWRPRGFEDRGGSGLGLFICRGLIREQGGDAGLDEAPGGGTMLRITLPAEG